MKVAAGPISFRMPLLLHVPGPVQPGYHRHRIEREFAMNIHRRHVRRGRKPSWSFDGGELDVHRDSATEAVDLGPSVLFPMGPSETFSAVSM